MISHILAGLVGAAVSFAVTRLANHLNGTDTAKADLAWLKAEYAALLAKFQSGSAVAPPAAPAA